MKLSTSHAWVTGCPSASTVASTNRASGRQSRRTRAQSRIPAGPLITSYSARTQASGESVSALGPPDTPLSHPAIVGRRTFATFVASVAYATRLGGQQLDFFFFKWFFFL